MLVVPRYDTLTLWGTAGEGCQATRMCEFRRGESPDARPEQPVRNLAGADHFFNRVVGDAPPRGYT